MSFVSLSPCIILTKPYSRENKPAKFKPSETTRPHYNSVYTSSGRVFMKLVLIVIIIYTDLLITKDMKI